MSGAVEHGKCQLCGKEASLQRTYFTYNIECDCCGGNPGHHHMVRHCSECVAVEPKTTTVVINTNLIKQLELKSPQK